MNADTGRLRHCRRLTSKRKRGLVRSQEEESQATQIARRSWPDGGDAQETNGQSRTRSDWAALVTNRTMGCDAVILIGALV